LQRNPTMRTSQTPPTIVTLLLSMMVWPAVSSARGNSQANCAGKTAVPQASAQPKSQPAQSASENAALDQVLERMDQTARDFHSTQADFVWKMYNSVINDFAETDSGRIYFRRTGTSVEMAADITQPARKQVIFSGGKIQILEPNGQVDVYDASAHREAVEAFLVLGFGSSGQEMRKSFKVQYLGQEKVGDVETAKLELAPISEKIKDQFPRIDLWIDPERGVSVRQQLFQTDGDYRLAEYSNFKPNEKIPDKVFKLRKSGNAKTVTHQ
jgi:outer membrane lipoprotein-sorting protein